MKILLFHTLKDAIGASELLIDIDSPMDSNQLWDLIIQHQPKLEPFRLYSRMACNQSYLTEITLIQPSDEIALIPPVSGG